MSQAFREMVDWIKDAIKKAAADHTGKWIASLLLLLLGVLWLALKNVFLSHIWPRLSKELLGYTVASTTILLLAGLAYIFYLRRKLRDAKIENESLTSTKLDYRFGVLWSKAGSKAGVPHCTACEIPLSYREPPPIAVIPGVSQSHPPLLTCAKCRKTFNLHDDNGTTPLTLSEAKTRLL